MGLEDLSQITKLSQPKNKSMIVGFEGNEDAGVYAINKDDEVIIQSVDFITPIIDDPYIYGQIAATNSLSDIFAMGALPKTALNLLMWDKEHVSSYAIEEILRGGLDKIIESGACLLGGHTISDLEQKYGLSVTGTAKKHQIWRNNTANIGDVLILTKPIGSGIITTALKNQGIKLGSVRDCIESMQTLNLKATLKARDFKISACTDVTGYGLIGHSFEMLSDKETKKSILFYTDKIPLFSHCIPLAQQGFIPGGSYGNKTYLENKVKLDCNLTEDIYYYDAQTSGGLLLALNKKDAKKLIDELKIIGYESASIIGEFIPYKDKSIILG